jgi:hypothetical protein
LLGALKGEVARHGEGEIGEVAGAGASGAQAGNVEDTVDLFEIADGVASSSVSTVWRASDQETRRMIAETTRAAMGSASSSAGMW